jgi:hypothetical protein
MAEAHAMEVRWTGPAKMAEVLKAAAEQHGTEVQVEASQDTVNLRIALTDDDLQTLRDRVDALLVALSQAEEMHG